MAVYTCTLNLAIDLFIETDEMKPFQVNRTKDDDIQANGKGVNVSLIMKKLGIDSTALGFKAGFTGNYIEDYLHQQAIQTDFIPVPGFTRINVFTHVNRDNKEYKLVNKGPEISKKQINLLLEQIRHLQAGDYLCISGSMPQGVSPKILIAISRICFEKQVNLIIDSSYSEVLECLPYQPFLLKPNEEELQAWYQTEINDRKGYIDYAKRLVASGAQHVLLSLGGEGGLLLTKDTVYSGNSPKGKVVNTACAGDTLLGTFLVGYLTGEPLDVNLKKGLAAGSSTAFRKGLTDFSDVAELEEQIEIKRRSE
ncbi:1-phosphofructokinase [Enterococcus gallinarum]|uniref:1-phosphofructokinase n=1 Tax=Enterococcus gallinarum TaxID=1353 RepID=UPI001376C4F2|nr:1-phosphofructokinase [Enterococcus gallinarum]NCE14898.1 1-phosphofructokinase [Enterococcus gallinarum]